MSGIVFINQVECNPVRKDITVQRLTWDWNDPSEAVLKEDLGPAPGSAGCWYICPMYKVFSPEPTREFLVEIRRRQREWFRELAMQFGASNWRRKMLVTKNVLERRLAFTGILIIHGEEIDPRQQYQFEAKVGLHPESDLAISRRPCIGGSLQQRDWEFLAQLSRHELEEQLASNPNAPCYVTPEITVMGITANDAFYAEVLKRSYGWHHHWRWALGAREANDVAKRADWVARTLIFNGALVIEGSIYLPGLWPNLPPRPKKLLKTPFGVATVPPEYLGLKRSPGATADGNAIV
jgi:hypothetical protein